jgi:G:T-mismatch repair DNA endonuclease (very short patch repair protein)
VSNCLNIVLFTYNVQNTGFVGIDDFVVPKYRTALTNQP